MLNEKAQGTGLTFKPSGLENAGLLQIVHKGVTVVSIDLCDGSVIYGEGYAADEAAKVFWAVVEQLLPIGICACCCVKHTSELRFNPNAECIFKNPLDEFKIIAGGEANVQMREKPDV